MAIAPKLMTVKAGILVEMLDMLVNKDARALFGNTINSKLKFKVSKSFTERALEQLSEDKLVKGEFSVDHDDSYYQLTPIGIDFVQSEEDRIGSEIRLYIQNFFDQSLGANSTPPDDISQPKELWEPLPIERERPSYPEMIEGLQKAYEEIRQSNGYSETHPEERDQIVKSLEIGIKWLREETTIRWMLIDTFLIAPLKVASQRLKKSATELAITEAIKAIFKFFWSTVN